MSRLTRAVQKVFAGSASNNGQFGSAQLGTFNLTNDVPTIQALSAWVQGWIDAAISGQNLPTLEEMQSVMYVMTYQLAYIFQEGIPEWEIGTTYYTAGVSIVKKTGTTELYASLIDNNTGNALPSGVSDSNWQFLGDLANLVNAGSLPTLAANTFLANATAGSAVPTGIALAASQLAGRGASGNIAPITLGTGLSMSANVLNAIVGITTTAISLAAPGYMQLSNGFIIQWGTNTLTGTSGGDTITFPVAFPNACFQVNATQHTALSSGIASAFNFTTTNFKAAVYIGASSFADTVCWIALGH